jgi:CRP/FNR family transcriptional regulator, cyclic AMP receptor protein
MPIDLKKIRLFSDFTQEELEEVRQISQRKQISQGEYIFIEGDPGETLILLDLGTLKLTKKTREGEEQELLQVGSGASVGEMAFLDQAHRSASGVAMEDCQLTVIPVPGLRSLLDRNPSMAAKFYKRIAMSISQRLKYMNEDFAALKKFLANGNHFMG